MTYIVVFNDEQGALWPMGWDEDCKGALCGTDMTRRPPVLFNDRASARRAIRVSAAFAKLCAAQGLPVNEDFRDAIKCVKIVKCIGEGEKP